MGDEEVNYSFFPPPLIDPYHIWKFLGQGLNPSCSCDLCYKYSHQCLFVLGWFFFFFFLLVFFLGPQVWHMEVPRLGVKLELQLLAYTTTTATQHLNCVCDLNHSSWQCWILNPLSKIRDWTCILMDTSQIRFFWAMAETLAWFFKSNLLLIYHVLNVFNEPGNMLGVM